jgi:hypothetical protein
MVHLRFLEKVQIFSELSFRTALYMVPFSASFLAEVVREVLPLEWEGVGALQMIWGDRGRDGAVVHLSRGEHYFTSVNVLFFVCLFMS